MSNIIASAFKSLAINSKISESNRSMSKNVEHKLLEHEFKEGSSESNSFLLWKDAMKMVARLPDGIPPEFRKQLWLTLARKHMENTNIKFKEFIPFCFSEENDSNDTELGTQIIKDLHRTGCSLFSGEVAELNQTHLKKVLLGYARWNSNVGYCQGFNMLVAIILEVVDWVEEDALMIMIFLIEEVLPESYFANHLRGLSVDMAVFRDLLRMRLTTLSSHLDKLQARTQDSSTGHIYEPPLTNVFTMQWFLTLFTNCLPKDTVLRVWDLILLEGNEVLLRTALTIWDGLADRIMAVESADEFYSIMGVLTREILEFGLMDTNVFLKTVVTLAPFPFPQLQELRDSYAYNIQPFSSMSSDSELQIFSSYGDDDDDDDDEMSAAKWYFSNELQWSKKRGAVNPAGFSSIGPGAYSSVENSFPLSFTNFNTERMTLDISALKKQYSKLRERQKQAHIILSGAFQNHFQNYRRNSLAVNHLLMGKQPLTRKRSTQKHLKFAEKKTAKKKDEPSTSYSIAPGIDKLEVIDSSTKVQAATEHGVLHVHSFTESASSFGCCPDTVHKQNTLKSMPENELSIDKCSVGNHSLKSSQCNPPFSENPCSCSLSFTCLAHVDVLPEKPQSRNPFPTKRRVGSMKNKSVTQ